jgi:hypothetical protein
MKVLFDHSVRQHALRGEHRYVYFAPYRPGYNNLMEPAHNIRPARTGWLQDEIDCLGKIAELCRRKKLLPYITEELESEEFRALKFPSPNYDDLFKEIQFKKAQCPIVRSKWGLSAKQYTDKNDIIAYCKCFFLTPSKERTEKFIAGMKENPRFSLSEFEERCLRNSDVFRKICRGISENHYPDALHLWTAEKNGLDVFLTMDKKFINVMARQKIGLHCRVMLPSDVLRALESIGSC